MEKRKINFANGIISTIAKSSNYSTIDALNELIDNAKDYGSTQCCIDYNSTDSILIITDNGDGMNVEEMTRAFDMGKYSKGKTTANASGYFGMGMKTGIVCLCNTDNNNIANVTIISSKRNGDGAVVIYNVSEEENTSYEITSTNKCKENGTTIIIKNTKFDKKDFGDALRTLGTIYYPILKDGNFKITLNGKKINAEDPLYRDVVSNVEKHFYKDTVNVAVDGKTYPITITASNLDDDIITVSNRHSFDSRPINSGRGGRCGVKITSRSGLYVIFGNRYISMGNNLSLINRELQPTSSGIRLEMEIHKDLISKFGVQWNKTDHLTPFDKVDELKNLAKRIREVFSGFISENAKNGTINNKNKSIKKVLKKVRNSRGVEYTISINYDAANKMNFASYNEATREITYNLDALIFDKIKENGNIKSIEESIRILNTMVVIGIANNENINELFQKFYLYYSMNYMTID